MFRVITQITTLPTFISARFVQSLPAAVLVEELAAVAASAGAAAAAVGSVAVARAVAAPAPDGSVLAAVVAGSAESAAE